MALPSIYSDSGLSKAQQSQVLSTNSVVHIENDYDVDMDQDHISYDLVRPTTITTLVLDTNFLLSHLNMIEDLRVLIKSFYHQIIIPIAVISELDGLKCGAGEVAKSARQANDWIYKHLANMESGVRGQKLRERVDKLVTKDDSILDCCLYFMEHDTFVVLLSNDKNLCLKALTEHVPTVSYRNGMTGLQVAEKCYHENMERYSHDTMELEQSPVEEAHLKEVAHSSVPPSLVYKEICSVVLSAVDFCMKQEYGDDLELVNYRKPDSLRSAYKVLVKHWVSVFSEYFPRSKKPSGKYVEMPNDQELSAFVSYWCDMLDHLYMKRDDTQNHALAVLSQRWKTAAV